MEGSFDRIHSILPNLYFECNATEAARFPISETVHLQDETCTSSFESVSRAVLDQAMLKGESLADIHNDDKTIRFVREFVFNI